MTNLPIKHHDFTVTAAAQTKIRELIHEADDDINSVRLFVSGGGCGGMDYLTALWKETRVSEWSLIPLPWLI